jgi:hypothetical protein
MKTFYYPRANKQASRHWGTDTGRKQVRKNENKAVGRSSATKCSIDSGITHWWSDLASRTTPEKRETQHLGGCSEISLQR